jgi:DNA polymerase-3 subunit beta
LKRGLLTLKNKKTSKFDHLTLLKALFFRYNGISSEKEIFLREKSAKREGAKNPIFGASCFRKNFFQKPSFLSHKKHGVEIVMKMECDRRSFLEAIQIVGGAVSNKESDPVLQQVKLQTKGEDTLELTGTDLEIGIRYILTPVTLQRQGEMVIPASRIQGILKEVGDEKFQLEQTEGGCILRCEGSTFRMVTYSAQEFPPMPQVDSANHFTMEPLQLREMIRRVIFATAKESTRFMLNGILFAMKSQKLTLVATDGKRLALMRKNLEQDFKEEQKIILPSKGLNHLEKIMATQEGPLEITFDHNHILFRTTKCVLFYKLLEGRFPRYEDVIPKNCTKTLNCSREVLLSKIRQASLLTNEKSKLIRFRLENSRLKISAHASNLGEADISMDIDYQGEPTELGFNPDYLVDILKIWWEETFSLKFHDEDTAGLIEAGEDFLYLVMPVSLNA